MVKGVKSCKGNENEATLSSTNMQENLTVTITVNDKFASYYFGKPIYRTYTDKFAGHSYLIEAKFSELNYPVSDVITIVCGDTGSNAIDYRLTAYEVYKTIRGIISRPEDFRVVLVIEAIKHENDIQWILEEFKGNEHFPEEYDNNAVVGG